MSPHAIGAVTGLPIGAVTGPPERLPEGEVYKVATCHLRLHLAPAGFEEGG